MILNLVFEIISPSMAYALTSGPAQEEFASFEPASTTDMVDMYSGDYNYNIPVLSVPGPNGGYPINIAYHSGIGMEQEASWVGLGWNLNVGAINRQLRGLPDDFAGQKVTKTQHLKETWTVALDIPKTTYTYTEKAGIQKPPFPVNNWQVYYNNYRGIGMRYTFNTSIPSKGEGESASLGLNVSIDSQNGIGIGLNFTASSNFGKSNFSGGFGVGTSFTSRGGLESFNFSSNISASGTKTKKFYDRARMESIKSTRTISSGGSSSTSFSSSFGVPKTNIEMKSTMIPFNLKMGKASSGFTFKAKFPLMWSGYTYTSKVQNQGVDNVSAYGYLYTGSNTGPDALKDFTRKDVMYSKKIPHLGTSSFTYDLYMQTGQGTGSMFRPHLNSFGILTDPQKISKDKTRNFGLEVGVPSLPSPINLHIGVDFQLGNGQNSSGSWTQIANKADMGLDLSTKLKNWTSSNGNNDYETFYFQTFGEKTGEHAIDNQLNNFGGDQALRLKISKETTDANWLNRQFYAEDNLVASETGAIIATLDGINQTDQTSSKKRRKRATSIEPLNDQDAGQYGYSKNVKYNDQTITTPAVVNKSFSGGRAMSEFSMVQADGMRYVYGLPVMNHKQIDNNFSVNTSNADFNTPSVPVSTSGSKIIGGVNVGGTYDEFVSKNEMPAYAHSWLLTSVLSNDYLDLTGDGPTNDDYGYWVKFNYKKIANDYQWRAPYTNANFIEGYKNNPNDDKAAYTFGTKEVYVIESIESKTHIAIFNTSNRHDAYDALDEFSGGKGQQKMQRLDKIKLYTKREYFLPGSTTVNANAIATKIVNFEYSYDLCPGVPNNDGLADNQTYYDATGNSVTANRNAMAGKLTLKKIYFTYQNSTRGAFSPYEFDYGNINDQQQNPSYSNRNMDRWGNFKNNTNVYIGGASNTYPYIDHPYTDQDPDLYNPILPKALLPAQWTLKKIKLPSGGEMNIEYEFDDYAYVENKRAMGMLDICGLGENQPTKPGFVGDYGLKIGAVRNGLTIDIANTEAKVNSLSPAGDNRVWVRLQGHVNSASEFKERYLDGLPGNYVYFSTYANIGTVANPNVYDYVKGYAEIDLSNSNYYGIDGSGMYGYITLKNKPLAQPNITGINVNPFTRAAMEHLRANRPEIIYNPVPYASGAAAQIGGLLGTVFPPSTLMTELTSMSIGFNNFAYINDWCKTIRLNGYSTIRLCQPTYAKKGGGVRVKKITLNDNWHNSGPLQNSLYGLEYDYTKEMQIAGVTQKVSTGVAYEPQVGSEESPLKTPILYSKSTLLHGSYHLFLENPIMEDYYPGAGVGYSKVTVKSIAPEQADLADDGLVNATNTLKTNAAPITVYEFYTQKDFPVLFDKTDMNPGQPIKQPLIIPGVFSGTRRRQTKSQGYSIVLNDMAGKPKSVTTLTKDGGKQISRQEFVYNTENPYSEGSENRLSSKVQTLELDNNYNINYVTSIIGQEHDMFIDMNEDDQKSKSFGMNINFDLSYTSPTVFSFWIMPLPAISSAHNNLRTVVFNKVINRTGILKKVITTTEQSTITSENLAYDIETGEALVTKVTNEFKDPIYNFAYPGHWYYPNMQGAAKNFAFTIDLPGSGSFNSDPTNGYLPVGPYLPAGRKITEFFAKGDLLRIDCAPSANANDGEYTVFSIDEVNNKLACINSLGEYFAINKPIESIKVIKSGFKNMLATKVGGLTFKEMDPTFKDYNPQNAVLTSVANPQVITLDAQTNKIINASAVEYSNDWQIFGGQALASQTSCVCYLNPVVYDYMNMVQNLISSGNIYSKNLLLYDIDNLSFNYGFNQNLINNSPVILQSINATLASGPYSGYLRGIRYSGELQSNGDLYMYFHNTALTYPSLPPAYQGIAQVCKIELHPSSSSPPINWSNISSITNAMASTSNSNCVTPNSFNISVSQNGNTIPVTISVTIPCNNSPCYGNCWNFYQGCNTVITPNYACGVNVGDPINPYLAGMKGMWRPKANYAYNGDRTQNNDVRTDGIYTSFNRFPWENPATKSDKWINATTVTKYSPYGYELENKDALGNYSSALYGYKHSLVTATSANAKYNEMAFDNFEDYPLDCNENHFKFTSNAANVTLNIAHTGKYSIKVANGANLLINKTIATPCNFTGIPDAFPLTQITHNSTQVDHVVNTCDLLGEFNPTDNKKYVASVWVRQTTAASTNIPGLVDYTAPQLKVTIHPATGPNIVYNYTAKGNVIDGWQRIFEEFQIPANAISVDVELVNTSTTGNLAYFDDIRLHPFDANMVSFVYDPISLKIVAELDANNFATIYTYDNEGHLNNVKKETIEGIKTIKEGRINTKKINE